MPAEHVISIAEIEDAAFFDPPGGRQYIEATGVRKDSGRPILFKIDYKAFLSLIEQTGKQIKGDKQRKDQILNQFVRASGGLEVAA